VVVPGIAALVLVGGVRDAELAGWLAGQGSEAASSGSQTAMCLYPWSPNLTPWPAPVGLLMRVGSTSDSGAKCWCDQGRQEWNSSCTLTPHGGRFLG
jgi:hypothetical protein